MATRNSKAEPYEYEVQLEGADDTFQEAASRNLMRPVVQASLSIHILEGGHLVEINTLVAELESHSATLQSGDLKRVESMLLAQAQTLEALFHFMLRTGRQQSSPTLIDTYLRIALKAQSQCRTTLEALAEIKNPKPIAFIKQANVANGHQQVNNTVHARVENSKKGQNKLLEKTHGERLVGRTSKKAVDTHSRMEAVAAIDRTKDARRKTKGVAKR